MKTVVHIVVLFVILVLTKTVWSTELFGQLNNQATDEKNIFEMRARTRNCQYKTQWIDETICYDTQCVNVKYPKTVLVCTA